MALITVDFETTFQFGAGPPKTFQFKDTTDYAGQGVNLADVTGVLKIIAPDTTTIYNNVTHGTPDIDPDISLLSVIQIDLPLLGGGGVQQGNYTITYTVEDTFGAPFTVDNTKILDLAYVSPTVDLDMTVNCSTPILTSTDNTPYTVGGVTPVIIRDHQILYPASTQTAPVVGTSAILSTNVFFTIANQDLQHSSSLVSTLTYTFAVDFIVTDSISGNGFIDVNCDAQLCDIYCCLTAQYTRYLDARSANRIQAELEFRKWDEMVGLAHQISIAQECGKGDDISAFVSRLLKLGNCEPGCGCDDGEPQLVVGLGGSGGGLVVVDSGGTPVIVTPVINGNTTTYTVSLAASFVSKVNDSFNSTVSAGANVVITTTIDANGNKDFKVDFTSNVTEPEILTFLVDIVLEDGVLPVVNVTKVSVSGDAFGNAPTVVNKVTTSVSGFLSQSTAFKIDAIWDNQLALQFKPDIHIIDKDFAAASGAPATIYLEMFDNNNTNISFRFLDRNGNNAPGNVISLFTNIQLQVTFNA